MNVNFSAAKYRQLAGALLMIPFMLSAQLKTSPKLQTGADQYAVYLPMLADKNIAVVANQTSMVGDMHLVDFLLKEGVAVKKVFAPEHGFRGTASAGEEIKDGKDTRTGLPIISLYGNNKKPTAEQLKDINLVIFDIQDVGARFYTYISTMTYVMEACAQSKIPLMILDRPNPHGHYIDGPVLEPKFSSFVGMHPVPVVHGMTIGEYARMVNGEGWLKSDVACQLLIIPCSNYDHSTAYELPVKPSPNLPNKWSVVLYPSLCFFEGTAVSVGRGTELPFQLIGAPWFEDGNTTFTPTSNEGAKNPPFEGKKCVGYELTKFAELYLQSLDELYLFWLVETYKIAPDKEKFFNSFFDLLAGTDQLRLQIRAGKTPEEIRESWQKPLADFKKIRKKYLLYEDFNQIR